MAGTEKTRTINLEIDKIARNRAKQRAYTARWNLDIAIFAFAVLIAVVVLLSQDVRLEIVAPVAIVGLALVWLAGWWHGRKLLAGFYLEELEALRNEITRIQTQVVDESVEEMIQKALKERRK
jgi:type VI protein secretion system component VasK